MSEPRWAQICEPESSATVSAPDFCVAFKEPLHSPIDDYYYYVQDLMKLGDNASLAASETLGRLLLLGLVTGVERYFRSVLAGAIRVCPICRAHAGDQLVSFGAVDFYGPKSLEWALFDSSSLAGADEIRSRTKKLLNIELPKGASSIEAALSEFDKLCHLRHASVHSRGRLGRGNAAALGLGNLGANTSVALTLPTLHAAAATCHSTVRAYNKIIFRRVMERWIGADELTGQWRRDRERFSALFDLFYSRVDQVGPPNAYQAHRTLLSQIS